MEGWHMCLGSCDTDLSDDMAFGSQDHLVCCFLLFGAPPLILQPFVQPGRDTCMRCKCEGRNQAFSHLKSLNSNNQGTISKCLAAP